MKDKIKIILLGILLIITCIVTFIKSNKQIDSIKFKNEYESLNNKTNSSGKEYPTVNINANNIIKYATFKEIEDVLTTKSGVIYFGFPECPWCRNAIEPLLEAASETNLKEIYYFNAYSIRDQKHLDEDGKIITDKEGTEEYKKLIELMYDNLGEYEGLEDKTIKRLYFPTVVFIKDGSINTIHVGTLEDQEDPYTPLTEKQKEKLKNIYKTNILKVIDTSCTNKC